LTGDTIDEHGRDAWRLGIVTKRTRSNPGPIAFVDDGLGNSSYLVDLGAGRALVVDPARHPGATSGRPNAEVSTSPTRQRPTSTPTSCPGPES